MSARPPALPAPRVAFEPDFLERLGRFVARLRAARERREGAGAGRVQGVGAEVVGFRPYRPGEDLRLLDWSLFARHRRPFLRVTAREASERWAVLLDFSASMGVGPPGKLQRAAEVACAAGALAARTGAEARLLLSDGREGPRLRRTADLGAWMRFLEGLVATGTRGLGELALRAARVREAGRVLLVGDFLDLDPTSLAPLARRGRELVCVALLAPDELRPPLGPVEWVDAESGARRRVAVDRAQLALYERRLERRLAAWRVACAARRATFVCGSSAEPFEALAGDAFAG